MARKILRQLLKHNHKFFSKKTFVLYFLNKRISEGFGTVIDLDVDRQNKTLTLDIEKDEAINQVAITGYAITRRQGASYLTWRRMTASGILANDYKQRFDGIKSLPVAPQYVELLERLLAAA